ncbi:MAG: VWA domain-containing protein [Bacteroidetes bacterium]|nr:MAG: VWA domain-containing protein [Bacteroidota bacterium]
MEFDQLIFKKVLNYLKRRKKGDPEILARTVYLKDLSGKLTLIARALTGDPIDIVASEREGGWKDNVFFLPEKMSAYESLDANAALYTYRIFYLSVQKMLGLNWNVENNSSLDNSRKQALNTAPEVLDAMIAEFPGLEEIHAQLKANLPNAEGSEEPDLSWLYGRWMVNTPGFGEPDTLNNISKKARKASENKITTSLKAKQADEIEVIQVDKKAQEDYMLTHNFEKVETIDEFNGTWRDFDGDDNLKEEADALEEFNLSKVVRVDDPVHSVYQAEFVGNATIAESKEQEAKTYHYSYPEWDFKQRVYKPDFCKVFHKKLLKTNADYYLKTLEHNRAVLLKLKKIFARLNSDRELIRRLPDGEAIDIDSVTDMYADIASGHTPDERLYMSKRKRRKELSILFLLDLSLSSDGYAKGNRIIDVEKQVSILFGETLNENMVDFQIDGFYSKTRNNTSYITLKSFDESWNKAKMRIGAIQPSGYTRIGPALRHATTLLRKRPMRKKWLILLSDGKPNDYDRYEGKYGIQDIKQALREMSVEGISNFALAIEEQAKYYLPQMFGQNHYNILSSPVEMIDSLAKLYKRIEHG